MNSLRHTSLPTGLRISPGHTNCDSGWTKWVTGYRRLTFSEMMASLCLELLMRFRSSGHHIESKRERMEELAPLGRGGMCVGVCMHIWELGVDLHPGMIGGLWGP